MPWWSDVDHAARASCTTVCATASLVLKHVQRGRTAAVKGFHISRLHVHGVKACEFGGKGVQLVAAGDWALHLADTDTWLMESRDGHALLTPEPVLSVLSSVPANDTAEAWFGYRQISPFSPPFGVFWSLLPDRPTGGVLTVIIDGPVQLPPATEGPPVPLTSPAMTLPNCSAGAS